MELNPEFLIEIFYTFCKRPIHKRYQNSYNAECPVCKEGKSSGRSRRLFYFPLKQYFYCHNCARSWLPFEWVKEVTNLSVPEILKRNKDKFKQNNVYIPTTLNKETNIQTVQEELPSNSIDLTDPLQLRFFAENKVVQTSIEYCKKRKLLEAVNTCKKFYLSLDDKVHKNRLIIPFFYNKRIVSYQTRSLFSNQTPKYKTKVGEKHLFGLDNIDSNIPFVFLFEGPIDSMFVRNGLAMTSLSLTELQTKQLNSLIGYEPIYVFDNDKNNQTVTKKINKCIEANKRIFIWPKEFKSFKDFNEICIRLNQTEIPWQFVEKNSCKGESAKLKFLLANSSLRSS